MSKKDTALRQLANDYIKEVKKVLDSLDLKKVKEAFDILLQVYNNDKRVFILGNGGSASTASHMAADLSKGTLARVYDNNEKRLRAISLTDNASLMTAYSNDLSYSYVFVQQLRNLIEAGDLLIALSGSGNSENVIRAVKYSKSRGAKTVGLLGFETGGKLAKLVDCAIVAKSNHYGPIEDTHLIFNHIMTSWFAKAKREIEGIKETENGAIPFRND